MSTTLDGAFAQYPDRDAGPHLFGVKTKVLVALTPSVEPDLRLVNGRVKSELLDVWLATSWALVA